MRSVPVLLATALLSASAAAQSLKPVVVAKAEPVAERSAKECLSLPIYPEMTNEQQDAVAAAIKGFFASPAAA